MKVFAFYLPQFHEIEENNKWWGKGFTDWYNVKNATKMIKNHNQPKVPYENNYYDLSNDGELSKQISIAKKYGIDGFCFYHYWFNGKKLLQKPIENFLEKNKEEFSYCLSWANEPWTRSWDGKNNEILIDQKYGDEKEWTMHFNYLLKFFKDERYEKIDNKPVFLIYRTANINRCDDMIKFWNTLAQDNGFNGMHVIETLTAFQKHPVCIESNAVVEFEPMLTLKYYLPIFENIKRAFKKLRKNTPMTVNYDVVWKSILKRNNKYLDKEIYLGAFVDWDNTPRKKERGCVFVGGNPDKFGKYLNQQFKKQQSNMIFINAWNEWAEGTYLEPDIVNGYKYLDEVYKAKTSLVDE